jgi:hypothetical protein
MARLHVLFFLDLGLRSAFPFPFPVRLFGEMEEGEWESLEPHLADPARPVHLAGLSLFALALSDVRFCVKEREDVYGYRRHRAFIVDELRQELVGPSVFVVT